VPTRRWVAELRRRRSSGHLVALVLVQRLEEMSTHRRSDSHTIWRGRAIPGHMHQIGRRGAVGWELDREPPGRHAPVLVPLRGSARGAAMRVPAPQASQMVYALSY
jgi:hypothetical protein